MSTIGQRESLFGSALSAYHSGRRRGDSMPKHKHKPGMVMVISIGAKPKKKGETGVKKGSAAVCRGCGKKMNFPDTGRKEYCMRCSLVEQFGEDSPEVAEDDDRYGD